MKRTQEKERRVQELDIHVADILHSVSFNDHRELGGAGGRALLAELLSQVDEAMEDVLADEDVQLKCAASKSKAHNLRMHCEELRKTIQCANDALDHGAA